MSDFQDRKMRFGAYIEHLVFSSAYIALAILVLLLAIPIDL